MPTVQGDIDIVGVDHENYDEMEKMVVEYVEMYRESHEKVASFLARRIHGEI